MITAYGDAETKRKALESGADALLTKPIDCAPLRAAIDTRIDDRNDNPGSTVSMNLFRIYKESLANVIKHAKASAVEVSFSVDEGKVVLDIRDNGIGLDGRRVRGRGLPNMKIRAKEMGGSLAVTTDNGTRVHLALPIP